MDNINLRKIAGFSPAFTLSLMLITAAFALGAVSAALLIWNAADSIMSIRQSAQISAWICLVALLFAAAACLVIPSARALSVLVSAACGAVIEIISYLYSDLKLFSADFFIFIALIFTFTVAITYISDCVFALSPKLRAFIRADHKLRHELNVFSSVSLVLILAAIIFAAMFIL